METITLTTYYPAPYGVYFQLATKRLSVGLLTQADQPNRDGDMRLQPQPGDPTDTIAWPVGPAGQLAYSQTKDAFYHSNGSQWVADSGGSSGTVMYLDCADYGVSWALHSWPSCMPIGCPVGWTSAGITSSITTVGADNTGMQVEIWGGKRTNVCVKN